jgi:hypothetical protein
MDRRSNPFAPGAGLQPPELAGRDDLISNAQVDMLRVKDGRPVKGMMLLGLRGVGKTVLLNRLHAFAEDNGFETAKVEAPEGGRLAELIVPEIRRILFAIDIQSSVKAAIKDAATVLRNFIRTFKVSYGDFEFGMDPAPGRADTGLLEQDLPALLIAVAQAAQRGKLAIGVFIDEIQYLSRQELAALIVAAHQTAQKGLPLLVVGAGLPQIAALSGNAKSYAERLFDYPQVDQLTPEAAALAIIEPARRENVEFERSAIDRIVELTHRYPYFLQEWGFHVWNGAENSPITKQDVDKSETLIIQHLDKNFFRVRFDRLTALQQKYLRAMAELGPGPHKTGEIAQVLNVEASTVAPVRQQLIEKGMVWSQRHGETAFTVPLFDAFMRRQMPDVETHTPKRRNNKRSND